MAAGINILQNTMARGGDDAGEKIKNEAVRNKMKKEEKGERKKKKGREFSREKYYGCGGKGKGLLEKK